MYLFCTSKSEKDLANDSWFCMMLYQKILDTLPLGAKTEFQRDCERGMEDGLLQFQDLKKKIITIARKTPIFERQQLSSQVNHVSEGRNSMEGSDRDAEIVSSINSTTQAGKKSVENRKCYYCRKVGHLARDCRKKQNDINRKRQTNNYSYNREPKTDGRRSYTN